MVSSPVQNLSDFLKHKPPLVVVLLCFVALAVSSFYFAFEIEKDGPTVDSDKQYDWNEMIKHFNKLSTCIKLSPWTDEIKDLKLKENFLTEMSIVTKVLISNASILMPYSHVEGALSLHDWFSTTCQEEQSQPKYIKISFEVPPTLNKQDDLELCVTITGPAQYLPAFKNPSCQLSTGEKIKKEKKGFLISKLPKDLLPKFCDNGVSPKLNFITDESEIINYLSDDVRIQIYIHLMWCSYFLVFIIFCFLIYAIMKKSEYFEKKEQAERLL